MCMTGAFPGSSGGDIRIPAYYCDECGHNDRLQNKAGSAARTAAPSRLHQDPDDVLDTWFSSALLAVFHAWAGQSKTPEIWTIIYPTDVLVTGYDIIFFWVARMIFSACEQMGEHPFEYGTDPRPGPR